MSTINLLYKSEYAINDKISIMIPTVGEIVDNEDLYYDCIYTITAMPIDMIVPLTDAGIDFSAINEWDLFLLLFKGLKEKDTHLIFGNLDLSKFEMAVNEQNGKIVLRDGGTGAVIDRVIHGKIASVLRTIHHLEKDRRTPANDDAKKYLIQRARDKAKRKRNRKDMSSLESLIIAMVNTEQFKYKFDEVRDLTIYQFRESVQQVIRKVNYDNLMHGVYSGTVNAKELNPDALDWLKQKQK